MSRKEFMSSTFSKNPLFDYMPEEEKYLFKKNEPKYKFNLIGAGMIGLEHIQCTILEGNADIKGIYDVSSLSVEKTIEFLAELYPGKEFKVYETLEDVCSDEDVDGLIISTPNNTHLDVIKTAMKYKKHIFMEKPMAATLEDAYEIMKLAQGYEPIFQVGLQYRYKANYVEAIHEALERKSLGSIKNLLIVEHRLPFLDKVRQWNKFTKYSGGTLVEKCCHYFDLFNIFSQSKPKSVYAVGDMAVNYKELEVYGERADIVDNASVIIKYENGVVATFHLCMFAPMFYEELVICGDEGRLKTYEKEDYIGNERLETYMEILHGELGKPTKILKPAYPNVIESSGHNGATFFEHKYFVEGIDGKNTSTATVEEGFWSVVIGVAAEMSIKRGREINISEMLKELGMEL